MPMCNTVVTLGVIILRGGQAMATYAAGSQWPDWMKPGVRVVRGPDWNLTIRDINTLDLGTLTYVPKQATDNTVNVVWDNGLERNYKSGYNGQYYLRAYDTAQVGIKHAGHNCTECKMSPIRGLRFHCLSGSSSVNLCMACYMNDKHNLAHSFNRYDSPKSGTPTTLPPRKNSQKQNVSGVFPKAEVIRGPHWKYKNADGGDTCKGTVLSFIEEKDNVGSGWVRVKWDINKQVEEYRLGAGGYVDVVAFKTVMAVKIYADHLPLVGIIVLKNGDKVTVNLTLKDFQAMQKKEKHVQGGWKDEMKQCLSEVGTVMELDALGNVARVQYENGQQHFVCRMALFRTGGFQKDGVVRIINNTKALKTLQEGHGGYNSGMDAIKGQLGRVLKVKPDGDMTVLVNNKQFHLSPVCCHPINDPNITKKVPKVPAVVADDSDEEDNSNTDTSDTESDGQVGPRVETLTDFASSIADAFSNMRKVDSSAVREDNGSKMFEAFTKGDLDTVQGIIASDRSLVDFTKDGRTILHMTCHEGYKELADQLLELGANTSLKDNDGHTPLHYAAFGKQPDCVQLLLENAADVDVQDNKGLTPLIISVNQPCIDSVQYLLLQNCDVNLRDKAGSTALHDAVVQKESQPIIVEAVLGANGANLATKNKDGFNVLHWAVIKDNRSGVAMTLKKNRQLIDSRLPGGFTALHIAAANDFIEVISTLLEGGADPNSKDDEDRTALHIAATQASKRIIELLVDKGAEVNAQDKKGDTALHVVQHTRQSLSSSSARQLGVSRSSNSVQIMYYLLEKGADLYKRNRKNVTPLDLVQDPAQQEMLKQLTAAYHSAPPQSQGGVRLPIHWAPMEVTEVKIVTLSKSDSTQSAEYKEVEKHFLHTMPQGTITSIQRVQNALLWEHYTLKKRLMENKYGQGCANEIHLYHGTQSDLIQIIAEDNFDFRIAGSRVGALYGDGAYFATTSKYSDLYAGSDSSGNKVMFVAKVLAGKHCLGNTGLKRPPLVNPHNKAQGMYDSTVNNVMSPTIYCVFDKNQYYPEYVILYQ